MVEIISRVWTENMQNQIFITASEIEEEKLVHRSVLVSGEWNPAKLLKINFLQWLIQVCCNGNPW